MRVQKVRAELGKLHVGRRVLLPRERIRGARPRIGKAVGRVAEDGHHGAERSLIGLAVGGDGVEGIEEDAVSATDRGLAVAEDVPSEAQARPEVAPGHRHRTLRYVVTGVDHAARRVRIAPGLLPRMPGRDAIHFVGEREERLPACADIQRQPAIHLKRVLHEEAQAMEARIFIFADALRQRVELTDQEVGKTVTRKWRGAIKVPCAVGAEVIDDVVAAPAVFAAEGQAMFAHGPAQRIEKLKLAARKAIRIAGVNPEEAGNVDVPLDDRIVEVFNAEVSEATRRCHRHKVAVGAIDTEQRLV